MSLRAVALKRFHGLRTNVAPTSERQSNNPNYNILRHKIHVAMLDGETFSELKDSISESHGLSWLHKVAPGFPVNGSKVTILHEPADFYAKLLQLSKVASKRITLASLYLGTGNLEQELVKSIGNTVQNSNGAVEVNILLDYMRGSRGQANSRKMLEPILQTEWGYRCQVFLYHTPKLRGLMKKLTPDRFNELIGLQHMKLYLFDDTLIISGANLSNDYFTNRQDRYLMIEDCKELCDFYENLVKKVGEFSFRLQSNGTTTFDSEKCHPVKSFRMKFTRAASDSIQTLFQTELNKRTELNKSGEALGCDTWIFPLIQMAQLDIYHDSKVTLRLLENAPSGATLKLATGYFNLTSEYRDAILRCCRADCHLLTAHPTANGFFGAKGTAGNIPTAYRLIEKSFFKMIENLRQSERVTLWEFLRPGWTYHAKGLWYTLPGQQKPCLTLVGSPNFGYRSVEKDLETQIALVTKNERLQDLLEKEQDRLFQSSKRVTRNSFHDNDRITPAWVRAAVMFFRYYF